MSNVTQKQKNWTSFSFFFSSLVALYTIMTGQWGWALMFSGFMAAQYYFYNCWYRTWKDESKR